MDPPPSTGQWYARFSAQAAEGSLAYARLADAVAGSASLLRLLDTLPEQKRQPNLLFAAARLLGAPVEDPPGFVAWVPEHWAPLAALMQRRRTQTNEPRRSATLLPLLASLPGPLALLEVGASAGLCLYPDRWRYRYGDHPLGDASRPLLTCAPIGEFAPPAHVPDVVWRAGIDLNPLDVTDPDDVAWLEALVWPGQPDRLERLQQAIAIARADPPPITAGDLNSELPALAARAPADATLVVFHSAVLTYLDRPDRTRFVEQVTALPGHWISNEGPEVLPDVGARVPAGREDTRHRFLTALDGVPFAWSGGHGQTIELLR